MPTDLFEVIRSKRAIRQFHDLPLGEEVTRKILEAGRLSGSAKNQQPWHFIAVQDRQTLAALAECGKSAGHLAGAALGVALVTEDPFKRITVPFDLGRAAQNMMLVAWSMGVGSVMATIYQTDRACQVLGVPASHVIPWCISFGYPIEMPDRPPKKGGRRVADDVIHYEKW